MVKLVVKLMVMIHVFDSWGSQSWRPPNLNTKFRGVLKFEVSQTFRQRTPQKKQIVHSCREPGYSDHTRFSRSSHTDDPNGSSSSKSYDIFTSRGEVLEEKQQDGSGLLVAVMAEAAIDQGPCNTEETPEPEGEGDLLNCLE